MSPLEAILTVFDTRNRSALKTSLLLDRPEYAARLALDALHRNGFRIVTEVSA